MTVLYHALEMAHSLLLLYILRLIYNKFIIYNGLLGNSTHLAKAVRAWVSRKTLLTVSVPNDSDQHQANVNETDREHVITWECIKEYRSSYRIGIRSTVLFVSKDATHDRATLRDFRILARGSESFLNFLPLISDY